MPNYTVVQRNPFGAQYDNLDGKLQRTVDGILEKLEDTLCGRPLKGSHGLRAVHFEHNKYRLLYSVDPSSNTVFVERVGPRERVYTEASEVLFKKR